MARWGCTSNALTMVAVAVESGWLSTGSVRISDMGKKPHGRVGDIVVGISGTATSLHHSDPPLHDSIMNRCYSRIDGKHENSQQARNHADDGDRRRISNHHLRRNHFPTLLINQLLTPPPIPAMLPRLPKSMPPGLEPSEISVPIGIRVPDSICQIEDGARMTRGMKEMLRRTNETKSNMSQMTGKVYKAIQNAR